MNVPNKFVFPLDEDVVKKLEFLVKDSKKAKIRLRANAIILSSKGFSIDEIAKICGTQYGFILDHKLGKFRF